ncbi:hypothetical protein X801_04211, partial [Opisthorchis viverrini]
CGKAYRLLGDHHLARVHLELGVQCARQALGSKQIRKDLLIFALKELIEFKLVLGYSYIREGLRGRAIDEFESLLQYINEVFELSSLGHPTPVWAYHYLGSAFSLFAPVNDSELRLKVPVRFLSVLRFTEGQEFIDLDGGTMDLSAGFILAGIYFAGAFKRWSEIKTSPCPLPDATPTESHAVSRGCFLITLGLHCLSHATYLRKSRLSKSSSGLTLDTLLQLSESSLKQALNVLDTSAALDQRFLDAQDADEDISEVIKISRMDTTEEQRVRDRLSINGVLRSKAWYGLAMLHSVVGGDFDAQIDYCLCQALLASPTITEGGTSLALRLLHQGRSQFATSLLAHFQAADPDNFAVWLASAHLHALTEAPETRPITHAESDSSVQINHAVLQDLLQAACLEANVQVSLQLSANLLPLLVDSVCSAHNRRNLAASTHLQKSRAFLRLAVEVTTEALSRALAYEPQNARLWHHRGLFLQLAGLSKPAEYCFQKTNPDWSVADLLLSLSGEYSPCVCASLAEAFAKGIIFLHHPSLSHQFDMAFKCLVDEPSRLASQGCSAALSSLNVFPHVGKWLLILSCLDRPDETSLRCSASLLTELLSTPSVTFSPLHPHLVQLLSSAGVSLMHLFSPQDTTLFNLSKVCRLRHQDYEDTVENPVESMHTGHVLYENGHLDASERAVWIMNDAMLSTYVSGSRVSSGLAYISRFVARRPDDPVRWNALAHWALERCRSMVEPPADQELREKKRLKSAKSKRFSFEWSVLFQAIATSLRLQSEIPMD